MSGEDQGNEIRVGEAHVTEWLPAYALNILAQDEMALTAEHLANCPACQAELRLYQAAADELPLALAQSAPRPELKNRLMKEIRSRKAQSTVPLRPTFWQQMAAFFRRSAPAWAAALILVLVLGNLLFWRRLNQITARQASSMRVIALASTNGSPRAAGILVMSPSGRYGSLVVDHLEKLDAEHQYQVWLTKDGERTSGGIFSVGLGGYAVLELHAPISLIEYQAIGITIEPAGGSPGPTGAKVLGGDIQQ
jgi:anti-sigma-K factor RskA